MQLHRRSLCIPEVKIIMKVKYRISHFKIFYNEIYRLTVSANNKWSFYCSHHLSHFIMHKFFHACCTATINLSAKCIFSMLNYQFPMVDHMGLELEGWLQCFTSVCMAAWMCCGGFAMPATTLCYLCSSFRMILYAFQFTQWRSKAEIEVQRKTHLCAIWKSLIFPLNWNVLLTWKSSVSQR